MNGREFAGLNNDALDRLAIRKDGGFKFELVENFCNQPIKKDWLIKGIIARGETSAWIAPPGAMKSALMAELATCVADQRDWHGHRATACHGVLYFALERADLVRRRLSAHYVRLGLKEDDLLPLAVVPAMVDLMNPATVPKVMATIEAASACFGQPVRLIIFDTFAKLVAAGGGDEDKAKDQGRVFANVQRIKDASGAHIAFVGHTGKDETRGSRGSNAILGDVDLMVTLSGGEVKTATVTKANDAPEGPLFSFKSEVHEFGMDEDGQPITVNIVSPDEVESRPAKGRDRWTKGLRLVRDCVEAALIEAGAEHAITNGPIVRAVPVQTARAIHASRYVSDGEGDRNAAERKAWSRNFKAARDAGLIGGEAKGGQEWIWLI
jgi:AAA domain